MAAIMEDVRTQRVEQMIDYIMKKCLWQFHSRAWDREKQNKGVLGMATRLLCDESVNLEEPVERCYWVDAVSLVEAYRERFAWLTELDTTEIKELMQALHERLDFLTITGSLNLELTDQHY